MLAKSKNQVLDLNLKKIAHDDEDPAFIESRL